MVVVARSSGVRARSASVTLTLLMRTPPWSTSRRASPLDLAASAVVISSATVMPLPIASAGSATDGAAAKASASTASDRPVNASLPNSTSVARSASASPSSPWAILVASTASRRWAMRRCGAWACSAITASTSSSSRKVNMVRKRRTSSSAALIQYWK